MSTCAQLLTKTCSVPSNASSQSKIECVSFKSIITNKKLSLRTETKNQNCAFICHNLYNHHHVTKNSNTIMCQSKSFNASTTPMATFSFVWPNNAMYLSTATNSIASSSFTQPTNSTRFSTRTIIKARTEHRQVDIHPPDIAIDMVLEEKSDDLMDLIANFEKWK